MIADRRAGAPPLRPPAVLRPPVRLLRLRHRQSAGAASTAATSTRCSRSWARARPPAPTRRDGLPRRRHTDLHRAGGAGASARGLPAAAEMTVEANPETVTAELAALLREHGVDRVSLGAQSFQPHLLEVLERRCRPGRRPARRPRSPRCRLRQRLARPHLRHPGPERRRPRARPRRGARARAGAPLLLRARGEAGHALHARARRRARASGRGDGGLLRAGRRDADRARATAGTRRRTSAALPTGRRARPALAAQPRLLARTRLPRPRRRRGLDNRRTGAGGTRRRSRGYLARARGRGAPAARGRGARPATSARRERVMLGLRLDEPLALDRGRGALDEAELERLERLGLAERSGGRSDAHRRAAASSATASPRRSSPSAPRAAGDDASRRARRQWRDRCGEVAASIATMDG